MRAHLTNARQKLSMGRRLFEGVKPKEGRETALPLFGIKRRGQQLEKPALSQVLLRRKIRRQLFGRDIKQHDLKLYVRLNPPRQQIKPAPLRLDRLEVRVVQDQPHRGTQRCVHGLQHLSRARIGGLHDMRADNPRQDVIHRTRLGQRPARIPDQSLKIREFQVRRHTGASGPFRQLNRRAMRLGPGFQLLLRAPGHRPDAELLAQPLQRLKDLDLFVKLVGMQIVQFLQLHLDPHAILADGQRQRGRKAFDNVLNRVHIQERRRGGGQSIAHLHHTARRTAREITKERHAKLGPVQVRARWFLGRDAPKW